MPSPSEIRHAREQAGLSQTAAAALIDVTRATWAKWEAPASNKVRHPMPEPLWALWRHLAGLERIPYRRHK